MLILTRSFQVGDRIRIRIRNRIGMGIGIPIPIHNRIGELIGAIVDKNVLETSCRSLQLLPCEPSRGTIPSPTSCRPLQAKSDGIITSP